MKQSVKQTYNDPLYPTCITNVQVDSKREYMGQSTMFKENIIIEIYFTLNFMHAPGALIKVNVEQEKVLLSPCPNNPKSQGLWSKSPIIP